MFEIQMHRLKQGLCALGLTLLNPLFAQDQTPVDFVPALKKGDKMVYQLVETTFRQNSNGHYLYLRYDTSYMIYRVTEKNDSQTLMDFNYADAWINNDFFNISTPKPDYLRSETYKLVFNAKGQFIELSNWEFFAGVLINNLKELYMNKQIDSNTLKYYYVYYHNQEYVEKAVIPRVLEMVDILGETYHLETNYSLAREMVNPFEGNNLSKSCIFRATKDNKFPNSVFFGGKLKSTAEDNECLQEDYYAYYMQKKPDENSETEAPYIYMEDTYNYQWGLISKRILSYNTTHTVYIGSAVKQGLDREFRFFSY